MDTAAYNALMNALTDAATGRPSPAKIAILPDEQKDELVAYLMAHKRPIIAGFVSEKHIPQLRQAGYLDGYQNQYLAFWILPGQAGFFTASQPDTKTSDSTERDAESDENNDDPPTQLGSVENPPAPNVNPTFEEQSFVDGFTQHLNGIDKDRHPIPRLATPDLPQQQVLPPYKPPLTGNGAPKVLNGNGPNESTHNTENGLEQMPLPPRQDHKASLNNGQTNAIDYTALLADARIRPTDVIERQPGCLFIEKDGKEYVVGSLGDISTVTGKAKSKKTFAISFAVAAAVTGSRVLERIKGALPAAQNTVLLFDTEQSRYHVWRVVKRICRLCGIDDPPNLVVYSLRPHAPNERLKMIDVAINTTAALGLVVIDGVRDLAIDPVMNGDDASDIMTHLLRWTADRRIHIMTVLHQNKADRNVRGVLGSELVNKSETVIEISRDETDKEVSHVEPKDCRNQDFPPFSFSVDDHGVPSLVEENMDNRMVNNRSGKAAKNELPTADNMSTGTMRQIIQRAFAQEQQLSFSQLLTNITEASQHAGATLSDKRARSFIQRVSTDGMVEKFRPEKARWNHYRVNPDYQVESTS